MQLTHGRRLLALAHDLKGKAYIIVVSYGWNAGGQGLVSGPYLTSFKRLAQSGRSREDGSGSSRVKGGGWSGCPWPFFCFFCMRVRAPRPPVSKRVLVFQVGYCLGYASTPIMSSLWGFLFGCTKHPLLTRKHTANFDHPCTPSTTKRPRVWRWHADKACLCECNEARL